MIFRVIFLYSWMSEALGLNGKNFLPIPFY
jgi:hypothetical protein